MRKVIFIICLLITQMSYCQRNFVDGYLILKGEIDTLKVQIDDRNWDINPNTISVKFEDGKESVYDISLLSAFGIKDKEHYIITKTSLDITPFTGDLRKSSILEIKHDTTMALLVLLKAENNLLYFKDNNLKEHFFYKTKFVTRELINQKFILSKNFKNYEIHNKLYQKQLDTLFMGCNKILTTSNLIYNVRELIDKFIEFNDCMGCSSICYIEKKEDKNILKLGICYSQNFLNEQQYFYDPFESIQENSSKLKTISSIGITANIYSKRNRAKKSINIELLYKPIILKTFYSNEQLSLHNLNYSIIYRNRALLTNGLHPFYGIGLSANSLVFHRFSNIESYSLRHNNFNPKAVLELGVEVKHFLFSTRVNYDFLERSSVYFEYRKVAEIIFNTTFSRISSQLFVAYQF